MKLINPLSPNARLAIAGSIIEADAKGVVEIDNEDVAASLLRSGYVLVEKHEADKKVQAKAAKDAQLKAASVAKEVVKAAEEEAKAAQAQAEVIEEEVTEEEVTKEEAETEDKPKRGWQRKTASKK